jgi:hypothetical protein
MSEYKISSLRISANVQEVRKLKTSTALLNILTIVNGKIYNAIMLLKHKMIVKSKSF